MWFLASSLIALAGTSLAASVDDCGGYTASNVVTTPNTITADLALNGEPCNVYGQDLQNLKLLVEYQTETRLHVKIFDVDQNVYQIQESVLPSPPNTNVSADVAALAFSYVENPFSFAVTRVDSGAALFNTSGTQLVFESQYVRLRTQLPANANLYGLGEHSDSFRLGTQNYHRTLWNAESPFIPRDSNLYGSHPIYLDHRGSAGTHGVFLRNANGMDININQTENAQYLEYNTLGGVLDLYFMAGPTPTDVSTQYAQVVGLPAMVPYWTFGFHQCKYGYWDVNYAAEVVANYSTAGIPLEVMWLDIDVMDARQDFTIDPDRFPLHKMRELIDTLHQRGQRYITMVDPGIHKADNYSTYTRGAEKDVYLKADDGSFYRGVQWAGEVVWPDWFAANTQEWWNEEFATFFDAATGIDVDGVWNDMNEGSNFCPELGCDPASWAADNNDPPPPSHSPRPNTGRPIPGFPEDFQPTSTNTKSRRDGSGKMLGLPGRDLFHPAYHIQNHQGEGDLSSHTLWTNISNADGSAQYDTHNLYGLMMAIKSRESLIQRRPGQRPFVLTRSTFAGSGNHSAHWFGDNDSNWDDYRVTIAQMLASAAIYQSPMVGSDVCGFNGDAQEHMCARWAMLGAFQPFYRNHADISAPFQEFYLWESVAAAARKAIAARYRLLDYIYTTMYTASTTGQPMINPLFFLYGADVNTFGIDLQWFLGDALLISPVVDNDAQNVTFYLPDDIFYDFWTFHPVRGNGTSITLDNVGWSDIPVHIRGGAILPLRVASANTTAELRKNNFTIVVAPGLDGKASGRLHLDDGLSLDVSGASSDIVFSWDGSTFRADGTFGYKTDVVIESVVVLGTETREARGGPWTLDHPFAV